MKALAPLLLLLGCSHAAEAPDRMTVTFWLEGTLTGVRTFVVHDEQASSGPRIACTQSRGRLVVSAVTNYGEVHGAGVYLRIAQFGGPARYDFGDEDRAWVFDDGHIQLCTRPDDRACFQGSKGCSVVVDSWTLAPGGPDYPRGVLVGEATGSFTCSSLSNANTGATVGMRNGTFRCRAEDWTGAGL